MHIKKIRADKCNTVFALTFFLTALVNIYLAVLLHFLQYFCY